jgi:hypothetical protein
MHFDQANRAVNLLTKAAPAAAKARARLTDEARAMGRSVLAKRATDKAVAPVIRELQAAGVTSLGALQGRLTNGAFRPGSGTWQASQVSRMLARL